MWMFFARCQMVCQISLSDGSGLGKIAIIFDADVISSMYMVITTKILDPW